MPRHVSNRAVRDAPVIRGESGIFSNHLPVRSVDCRNKRSRKPNLTIIFFDAFETLLAGSYPGYFTMSVSTVLLLPHS